MKKAWIAAQLLLALIVFSGCAETDGAPAGTASPDPTAEETQMPEPTPAPTAEQTATPTPAPTETPEASGTYMTITAEAAMAMMADTQNYVLLDVRTQEEYEQAHIAGALLLPYDEIAAGAEALLPDKDALILVYCRSGRRSAIAAQALSDLGYTQVYDFGGIVDWPYETVSGAEAG